MAIKTPTELEIVPIVPMDAETSAMLTYTESPHGRERIEKARQELRDGKGIIINSAHIDDLNHRISKRVTEKRSTDI